ncbi:hypothetical protein LTR09_006811 [Extremus antarcticus]|uniref:N-acetylglucosamine-6-phosphate deacetylase n=1 Tax=Extremus antarcticus TaxID=702011 RepID=A0AAJ0DLK7_9PEZI|nr:hypothetical protein LTR09_006811 [Extremus antarcticus]
MSSKPTNFVPDYSATPFSLDLSLLPESCTIFTNCRLCIGGRLTPTKSAIIVSNATGQLDEVFTNQSGVTVSGNSKNGAEVVDLHNAIVAPGFIELQTNGLRGFHFTHFTDKDTYAAELDKVSTYLPSTGVTGFYATLPTVASDEFKRILPSLAPTDIEGGASLLGAHAEGPYLHPSKKGAHNSSLFHQAVTPPVEVYGDIATNDSTLKLVTIAPELENANSLISDLVSKDIRVSLGHSNASYAEGLSALEAGATCLTHTLNAMAPLHHRDPGLAGLVTAAPPTTPHSPWFSIIPDGNHLHPSMATMLFRSNPEKCILITDSIELAGLEDGTYPGHSQIPFRQTKKGSRVVIEGTETLIGGCASLSECVRNLMQWSGCGIAEAVKCVTENVVEFMGDEQRGRLEAWRRADFVVMDDEANVMETWVGGKRVWKEV